MDKIKINQCILESVKFGLVCVQEEVGWNGSMSGRVVGDMARAMSRSVMTWWKRRLELGRWQPLLGTYLLCGCTLHYRDSSLSTSHSLWYCW